MSTGVRVFGKNLQKKKEALEKRIERITRKRERRAADERGRATRKEE